MTPNAIYSKSGKGVQEAAGKTSLLSRGDRAVLSAFDGKLSVSDVADRVGKPFDNAFQRVILQLEKDGYIREVSAGTPATRPGATPARPAAGAARPAPAAAAPASGGGSDLDFTIAIPASPPPKPRASAAPPPVDPAFKARAETERKAQEDNMARARREAEERAQKERDRVKAEVEAKVRIETEATLRTQAQEKAQADAEAKLRAEAEAKVKAAREAAVRIATEAKAKVEAEMQAKLEAERARAREETERARREAEELRQRLEEERKEREAEERKRKEEEERRRNEEEARRAREEAERKAREAEERKRREEEERRRKEEDERRALEEAMHKAREAEERRIREENERLIREMQEGEAREKREREEAERKAREELAREEQQREEQKIEWDMTPAPVVPVVPAAAPPPPAPASDGGFGDLMADLDSFSDRDAQDKKAQEAAERKEKEEKKARKEREEIERKAKEEAEQARKEAEEQAAKDERRRKEEEQRRARAEEEERAKREVEDRKRREREAEEAAVRASSAAKSDDIGVSDDDLDMDDVKRDQEAVSKESRKAAREREREAKEREREARERAKEREREAKRAAKGGPAPAAATSYKPYRRKRSWGKPVAVTLFILLAAGIGVLHVMPISTVEYEKAASEAIGYPVKIGAAHLSLTSGLELKLDGVSVGAARIASVRAFPEIGSLFDDRKAFSRIELEGVTLQQQALGEVLAAKLRSRNFSVARLSATQIKLVGPLPLPVLDADMLITSAGSIGVTSLRGPDNLVGKLTPTSAGIDFDVTASGFTLPFMTDVTLSTFAMKGRATNDSARIESWGGASLDGAISGTANLRWGENWSLDGVMTARGINAAVFAPALLSEGKAEGTGRFSMSDPDPTNFSRKGRVEGTFSMNKGVLGSFDLSRAILTGGRQATGRTPFTEMSGQASFEKGTVELRNVTFHAGAMNASATADITPGGALSGRIVADIRTTSQNLRATVNIGGTVTEPLVK